jgi:hypothetical protein
MQLDVCYEHKQKNTEPTGNYLHADVPKVKFSSFNFRSDHGSNGEFPMEF